MKLKGKKLLVLAGAAVHCKGVEAAKKMGVYTIVTDYLETSPAKEIADEAWKLNIMDVDAIVEKCRAEKVDGVLSFCIDPAQRPYYEICKKLNVPCYGTGEQFFSLTDKPTFKKCCAESGLDIIPTYSVDDVLNDKCEYPIFVKPTDSRGSRGQAVCYNKDNLMAAIEVARKESSDGGVVIEKFMQGMDDFSMTYFVCNGVPYLIRTCDRYLGRIEDKLNKQCVGCIAPSKHTKLYLEHVHNKVVKFIETIGLKNGPIFMQGFVDGNKVRFYDPGLRFPGGEYERLLKEATGVDVISPLVEFALTGTMEKPKGISDKPYELNGHYTIQIPVTARPGTIKVFEGLDEISRNPKVTSAFTRYEAGKTVPDSGDIRQRICEVALVIDKDDSVSESVAWVHNTLVVLDEDDKDMLTSLVDTSKLVY